MFMALLNGVAWLLVIVVILTATIKVGGLVYNLIANSFIGKTLTEIKSNLLDED